MPMSLGHSRVFSLGSRWIRILRKRPPIRLLAFQRLLSLQVLSGWGRKARAVRMLQDPLLGRQVDRRVLGVPVRPGTTVSLGRPVSFLLMGR